MLRLASTSILLLAAAALLLLVAVRLVFSGIFVLSGVRRHQQVLNW
jgi:hypothetical protein